MGIKDNIKTLREKYKLSQKELAVIAGVSDKAVSTWENGTKEPRMGAIQKMADHFNIKKSNLIEDDGLIFNAPSQNSQALANLTAAETALIKNYRKLNITGKRKVAEYVSDLTDTEKYTVLEQDEAKDAG